MPSYDLDCYYRSATFPTAHLTHFVTTVRAGNVADHAAELANDLHVATGYLAKVSLGVPGPNVVGSADRAAADMTDEQADELRLFAKTLEKMPVTAKASEAVVGAVDGELPTPKGFNPLLLSLLLRYGPELAKAIFELLKKRRAG